MIPSVSLYIIYSIKCQSCDSLDPERTLLQTVHYMGILPSHSSAVWARRAGCCHHSVGYFDQLCKQSLFAWLQAGSRDECAFLLFLGMLGQEGTS